MRIKNCVSSFRLCRIEQNVYVQRTQTQNSQIVHLNKFPPSQYFVYNVKVVNKFHMCVLDVNPEAVNTSLRFVYIPFFHAHSSRWRFNTCLSQRTFAHETPPYFVFFVVVFFYHVTLNTFQCINTSVELILSQIANGKLPI